MASPSVYHTGPNNANNFLKVQGGGGIHHVGIHTNDLISMVKETRRREIPFQLPPPDYYTEVICYYITHSYYKPFITDVPQVPVIAENLLIDLLTPDIG